LCKKRSDRKGGGTYDLSPQKELQNAKHVGTKSFMLLKNTYILFPLKDISEKEK
jgi:hypothetical protein